MQKIAAVNFLVLLLFLQAPTVEGKLSLRDYGGDAGNFIIEEDPLALVSAVHFVLRTGSLHDPKGKEGMAELSFNSLLRGTKKKSRAQFAAAIEGFGASIDVDVGASRTIVTLYTISENLEPAIALLAEALLEPAFRDGEIANLKREHLAQLDQARSSTNRMVSRAYRLALFQGTPLEASSSGTLESVRKINFPELKGFVKSHLNAGNALIAVSSNIERAKVVEWLERAFVGLPEGQRSTPPQFTLGVPKGRHLIIVPRKGTSTTPTFIGHTYVPSTYPYLEELSVGNFVFGDAPLASRLFKDLRVENGWTYGADSGTSLDLPRLYGSDFSIYTFPATEHTEKAIARAITLYEEYIRNGVNAEELALAKNSLGNAYPFQFASASNRMNRRIYNALDKAPLLTTEEYRARIGAIRPETLRPQIAEAHDASNLIIAVAGDPDQLRALAKQIPGIKSVTIVKDPIARSERITFQ